ncbi:MAG: signal peptide peptidase SppA [Phycisphaerae bacterium]|jgi:protease-4
MKRQCVLTVVALLATMTAAPMAPAQNPLDAIRNFGKSKPAEPAREIAYFKIKGALTETPVEVPPLFGSKPPLSLKSLLERLKEARRDPDIVAVVIDVQEAAMGMAQLQEIHAEVRKFAAVDKEVFIHSDALTTGTYAAATSGSHISMVPTGTLWLVGVYGESPYLRGTLDKLGCVPDFEQCGDYKSAGEMFTRTGPSDEAAAMLKWLLDGLYEDLVKLIADSRGMSTDKVKALIDQGPYTAEEALEAGLIDSVQHRQDFIADLKSRYGKSVKVVTDYGEEDPWDVPEDPFAMFAWMMKMFNPTPKTFTEPSVAIVYVEGVILPGAAEPSPFGPTEGAYSTTIRKALDKAAEDDSVKAVVLRVDSPGGSALASEIILDASRRVAAKKPLVVSMGNVAGSGGYYVTCAADTIFADSSTITASIGVISGKIVTTGMWDKVGVSWHPQQRGEMAAILSSAKRFSDAERAKLRHYMETVYDIFKGHVTKARGDRLAMPIDELAGGRVFTGAQALDLGLVDKIGGLHDAIKFAANRAGIGEYEIRIIPEPANIFDMLMGSVKEEGFTRMSAGKTLDLTVHPLFSAMLPTLAKTDPQRFRAIMHALTRLQLVHDEGVVMMMPVDYVIR